MSSQAIDVLTVFYRWKRLTEFNQAPKEFGRPQKKNKKNDWDKTFSWENSLTGFDREVILTEKKFDLVSEN